MRRSGIITARRRLRRRGTFIRRTAMTAGVVLLLCSLAMSDSLRDRLAELSQRGISAVYTFSEDAEDEIEETTVELSEITVYALQLGVFDSEQGAKAQQDRLAAQGVRCAAWQRDKIRLICSVAPERELLDLEAAGGNEAYIIRDTLARVKLRLSCAKNGANDAAAFVKLPDETLTALMKGETARDLAVNVRWQAEKALQAHPENELYIGLAKAMLAWCDTAEMETDETASECFASVAMCTICREWRQTLTDYALSAQSTASAQRTPSTAADVMPPAYPAPSPQG